MVGIYKITSPSGKVYIGQSWNIEQRLFGYKKSKGKAQFKLYASFIKHGVKNHIFEVIHELPKDVEQEVLDKYEILYWTLYQVCGVEMLNIKEPGRGGRHSLESKKKMSDSKRGVKRSEEAKRKLAAGHIGVVCSEETKQKIRIALTGKCKSDSHKQKLKIVFKGRKHSEETKCKMKGRMVSQETRKKISIGNKGKVITEETKQRMRNSTVKQIIIQYDKVGCFIKEYESLTQAEHELKIQSSNISKCLTKQRPFAGGFIWVYKNN